MAALDFVSGANTKKMTANNCKNYDESVSAVLAIASLQSVVKDCEMKIASGDTFLKVRCGDCGVEKDGDEDIITWCRHDSYFSST